jgi:hypothetical protein
VGWADGAGDDADGLAEDGWLGEAVPVGDDGLDDGTVDGEGLDPDEEPGVGVGCWRRGVGDGLAGRVRAGADVWPAGTEAPAGAGTGRTSRYRANTPTKSPHSTRVEVRGRRLMKRPRWSGRYRVRRGR